MVTKSDRSASDVGVGVSSVQDVLATEPVIRRVIASRVTNPDDVDDLVHDCLERLLAARARLAPETVLPFGIVTSVDGAAGTGEGSGYTSSRIPIAPNLHTIATVHRGVASCLSGASGYPALEDAEGA